MKRLLIVTALVLALVMTFGGTALAETKIEVDWNGAGWVGGNVQSGNDVFVEWQSFGAGGNWGSFTGLDRNNNPYNYGVDTNTFTIKANITGGGYADMSVERQDTHQSMYGPAGQKSFASVLTTDGDAFLANRSTTNFASMVDSLYNFQSTKQITVSNSSYFEIDRWIDGGHGNKAGVEAWGSGDAALTVSAVTAGGKKSSVTFGYGDGCTQRAQFDSAGSGYFLLWAEGNEGASTNWEPALYGKKISLLASWVEGGINLTDFRTSAQ